MVDLSILFIFLLRQYVDGEYLFFSSIFHVETSFPSGKFLCCKVFICLLCQLLDILELSWNFVVGFRNPCQIDLKS